MDAEWFKQQHRRAGVTVHDIGEALGRDRSIVSRIYQGRQKMTPEQAKVFADVLKVSISEVLAHAGIISELTFRQLNSGLSEVDATMWSPQQSEADAPILNMAKMLGGGRPGVDIWLVRSRSLALEGYMEGDFLLVDHNAADRAKPGDVVLAQVYDHEAAAALTVLRRYEPPVLVASSPDRNDRKVYVVDGNNVKIRGVVIASWRGGVRH